MNASNLCVWLCLCVCLTSSEIDASADKNRLYHERPSISAKWRTSAALIMVIAFMTYFIKASVDKDNLFQERREEQGERLDYNLPVFKLQLSSLYLFWTSMLSFSYIFFSYFFTSPLFLLLLLLHDFLSFFHEWKKKKKRLYYSDLPSFLFYIY